MKLFRDVIIVIKAAGIYLALFAFCQRRGQFQTKKQENNIQCHLEKKNCLLINLWEICSTKEMCCFSRGSRESEV